MIKFKLTLRFRVELTKLKGLMASMLGAIL